MLDRPHNKIAQPSVKAYRYYRTVAEQPGRPTYQIVEYWIPELKIIFNSNACFKTDIPLHNDDANRRHYGESGTLTATTISMVLADNFHFMLRNTTPERPFIFNHNDFFFFDNKTLNDTLEEFNSLTRRSPTYTRHELKQDFERVFEHVGNDALKDAFKHYILNNELPDGIVLNDLLAYYAELETTEQTSIADSLDFELHNIPDPLYFWGEAPKHAAIDKPPTALSRYANEFLHDAGMVGAITSPILSRMTDSPALCITGLALSGLSLFGPKAYDRYHAPALIAARHERAKDLFSWLQRPSRIYANAM